MHVNRWRAPCFTFPLANHPARALMDIASIVEILNPDNASNLLSTMQARRAAERAFEADKAVRRVCFVVIRADSDERWLISFGPRGGWRKEWNFGNGA